MDSVLNVHTPSALEFGMPSLGMFVVADSCTMNTVLILIIDEQDLIQ